MISGQIKEKLRVVFDPRHLEVHDESHRHNVPEGAESHFKVVIVSDHFLNQRLLPRHRAVYDALAVELAEGVHALALHTYTPEEWQKLQDVVPASPDCRGAGTRA